MPRKYFVLFVVIYIITMVLVWRSAFVVGRDGVASEAIEYIYQECIKQ